MNGLYILKDRENEGVNHPINHLINHGSIKAAGFAIHSCPLQAVAAGYEQLWRLFQDSCRQTPDSEWIDRRK